MSDTPPRYVVLVIGPAFDYTPAQVHRELDKLDRGGRVTGIFAVAGGVGAWAVDWAAARGVDHATFYTRPTVGDVDDDAFMRAIQRNARMLRARPDLVLAFKGRVGTHWLIANAVRAGIPVKPLRPAL